MATKDDDGRYEHTFEDLDGTPVIDAGDDTGFDPGADDKIEIEFAGDDESPDTTADDDPQGPEADAKAADGEGEGEGGDDDADAREVEELLAKREREQAERARLDTLERENAELRKKFEEREAESTKATAEKELADLQAQYRDALEEGDTDKVTQINDKILDAKLAMRDRGAAPADADQDGQPNPGGQPQRPPLMDVTKDWLKRNPWLTKGTNKEAIETLDVIENQVMRANFDPRTPEFYDEIDRRMARHHPELVRPRQGQKRPNGNRKAAAPTQGPDGGAARRTTGKRVRLNNADLENMEQFGLDRTNPEHLQEYARTKKDLAQQEQRS